jgi:protein-tyrosine phosphatase
MGLTRVWTRIYLGSIHDATGLAKHNPHNITTAISLCSEVIRAKARRINYLSFPLADDEPVPLGEFDRIIDAIAEYVRWGAILIHCYGGMLRSPTITAAWMHVCGYKSIDEALIEIARLRPVISTRSNPLLISVRKHLR